MLAVVFVVLFRSGT